MDIRPTTADPRNVAQMRKFVQNTNMIVGWMSTMFADWTVGDSFGSLATQNADAVNIDGGAIDGTTIGGAVPAAGTFSAVTATTGTITNLQAVTTFGLVVAPVGPGAHIEDASVAHDVTGVDTVDQAALEEALDALGAKINEALARLERFGLSATE
jgi:hypothetical protein